jgi:H/ACA ribonucleoprotein complex subunit 2
MASDSDPEVAIATKEAKRSKKDKKSSKRSEADGVHKDKKDRKKDKESSEKLANALDAHLQAEVAAEAAADESKRRRKEEKAAKRKQKTGDVDMDGEDDPAEGKTSAEGALVYFAYPMADEKVHKKAFKLIKKGTSSGTTLPNLL